MQATVILLFLSWPDTSSLLIQRPEQTRGHHLILVARSQDWARPGRPKSLMEPAPSPPPHPPHPSRILGARQSSNSPGIQRTKEGVEFLGQWEKPSLRPALACAGSAPAEC